MSRRVAVVGSRSICNEEYTDPVRSEMERDWMYYHLDKYLGFADETPPREYEPPTELGMAILSGGSVGVDREAQKYAEANDIPFFLYKPYHLIDTKVDYSPRYFFTRNKQIVDNADEMVAFWDGESHGTADSIKFARKKRKPVTVIEVDDAEILDFA